jgi:hypothetical protein
VRAALIMLLVAVSAATPAAATTYAAERPPRLLFGVEIRIYEDEDGPFIGSSEPWVFDHVMSGLGLEDDEADDLEAEHVDDRDDLEPVGVTREPALDRAHAGAPMWLAGCGAATMIALGVLAMRRRRRAAAVAV